MAAAVKHMRLAEIPRGTKIIYNEGQEFLSGLFLEPWGDGSKIITESGRVSVTFSDLRIV